nr:udp-glycosyltransferase 89b2 [Quercus suber]
MSTTTTATGAHILAYTYPASGHIIPLLDLTHQLLRRGLTVTVVVIPTNLPLLQPLVSLHPSSLHPLVLPAPEPPTPSWKSRMAKDQAMRDLHYPLLLNWFHSHVSPPIAIISDFFLGWTHHLAKQLGLPRVVFSPSGASGLSVLFSLWRDLPKKEDPEDMDFQVLLPKIPNSPVYPWRQLPNQYKNCKEGDPDWEFSKSNTLDNFASWGLVVNSFTELERVYLDHLRTELGHDRVWAVGPLLPLEDGVVGSSSRALEQSGVEFILCVRGLDERHVGVGDDRDQFTNAKLLVDQLGVGIRAGENIENIPEPSQLAHLLVESVSATRLERVRVKELSDAALGSIKGGSSDKDLDEFVERLPRCCQN